MAESEENQETSPDITDDIAIVESARESVKIKVRRVPYGFSSKRLMRKRVDLRVSAWLIVKSAGKA